MARVKNPLLSLEAHGALQGIEYRTGHYGNVVSRRSIATPTSRRAGVGIFFDRVSPQQDIRSYLSQANRAWSALAPDHQAWWNANAIPPQDGRSKYVGAWIRLRQIDWDLDFNWPWEFEPPVVTDVLFGSYLDPYPVVYVTMTYVSGGPALSRLSWQPIPPSRMIGGPEKWRVIGDGFNDSPFIIGAFFATAPHYAMKLDLVSLQDASILYTEIGRITI